MNANKIIVNGKEVEFSLGIKDEEIERNEYMNEDTISLTDVVNEINKINEQDRKS